MVAFISGAILGATLAVVIFASWLTPIVNGLRQEIAKLEIDLRHK